MDAEGDVGLYYDANAGYAVLVAKTPGACTVTVVPYSGRSDDERAELFRTINAGKRYMQSELDAAGLGNDLTALTAVSKKLSIGNRLKGMAAMREAQPVE